MEKLPQRCELGRVDPDLEGDPRRMAVAVEVAADVVDEPLSGDGLLPQSSLVPVGQDVEQRFPRQVVGVPGRRRRDDVPETRLWFCDVNRHGQVGSSVHPSPFS